MERPENCPDKLYRMMCRTWQHRPSSRPSFLQIVSTLLDDAVPSFRNVSFYHSQEGQELLQQPQRNRILFYIANEYHNLGFLFENISDQSLTIDVTTPLKAEEDDFSLEGLDDSYLMDVRKTTIGDEDDGVGGVSGGSGAAGGASGGAAAHSPLR